MGFNSGFKGLNSVNKSTVGEVCLSARVVYGIPEHMPIKFGQN